MPGCASCACFAAALASSPSNGLPQSLQVLRNLPTQPCDEESAADRETGLDDLAEIRPGPLRDAGDVEENVLGPGLHVLRADHGLYAAIGRGEGDDRPHDLEGDVHDGLDRASSLGEDPGLPVFLLGHLLPRLHVLGPLTPEEGPPFAMCATAMGALLQVRHDRAGPLRGVEIT